MPQIDAGLRPMRSNLYTVFDPEECMNSALRTLQERGFVQQCTDIEGLSNAEAAARINVSGSALKTRLHRARGLLKKQLADFR